MNEANPSKPRGVPALLPSLYHFHHSRSMEDLPFWRSLWEEHGSPVLELGCGTGRITLSLAAEGADLVGLDNSLEMLAFLKSQISGPLAGRIDLIQADMADFCFERRFALAILPCNTYSMLDAAARVKTLDCVVSSLELQGVFAVSIPSPDLLRKMPALSEPEEEDFFIHPQTGNPVIVSGGWERDRDGVIFSWVYDHLLPDGRAQRYELRTRHLWVGMDVYLKEFQSAGLEVVDIYGDYDRSEYTEDSPHLIMVGTRR